MKSSPVPSNNFFSAQSPVLGAFVLTLVYWIYLFFSTSMEIKHDALGYQTLGTAIYNDGIAGFFKIHGSNVILYPLIITASMYIADFLKADHLVVQKFIQLLFFFAAQILLYRLLRQLNVRKTIVALAILYFGFSPALVNSALSSWSEVIAYPFVLGIILISVYSWEMIQKGAYRELCFPILGLSLVFFAVSMVREVYEYVFLLFIAAYLCLSFGFFFQRQQKCFFKAIILLAAVFSLYQMSLMPYKMMNLKYSGYKSLVLKGGMALTGGAIMRSQKLTPMEILSFLSNVPGDNIIKKFFGEKEYKHWYFDQFRYGYDIYQDLLAQGVPKDEIDKKLYQISIQHVLKNPLQYCFLTTAEGMKMLFWESTKIGFVNYPQWLAGIFNFSPFKNFIRLFMFLLTFWAVFSALKYLFVHRREIHNRSQNTDKAVPILYFVLAVIIANIALHAPFIIETRYALPIAPLYLALIAFTLDKFAIKH